MLIKQQWDSPLLATWAFLSVNRTAPLGLYNDIPRVQRRRRRPWWVFGIFRELILSSADLERNPAGPPNFSIWPLDFRSNRVVMLISWSVAKHSGLLFQQYRSILRSSRDSKSFFDKAAKRPTSARDILSRDITADTYCFEYVIYGGWTEVFPNPAKTPSVQVRKVGFRAGAG